MQTIEVKVPLEGPLSKEQFFAPRAVPGLRAAKRLSMGTAGLAGVWGKVDLAESIRVLHDSWNEGFLLVDSSPNYGVNGEAEKVLGRALQTWRGAAPVLCTKIEGYPDFQPPKYAKDWPTAMMKQFEISRQRFGGRRIDGLAMHDAEGAPPEFAGECDAFLAQRLERGDIGAAGLGGGGPTIQPRFLHTGRFRYIITYKRLTAVSLQAMNDSVPACRSHNASVMVGSAVFMGLLGSKYEKYIVDPPSHIDGVFVRRAIALKKLGDESGLSLSHLALRFVLSMPVVDFVLAGSGHRTTWEDTKRAYEAGPLPADLYRRIWSLAQQDSEPLAGG